jgi:hypothetical protein
VVGTEGSGRGGGGGESFGTARAHRPSPKRLMPPPLAPPRRPAPVPFRSEEESGEGGDGDGAVLLLPPALRGWRMEGRRLRACERVKCECDADKMIRLRSLAGWLVSE